MTVCIALYLSPGEECGECGEEGGKYYTTVYMYECLENMRFTVCICNSAKGAGGRLQLNTHASYVCVF